MEGWIKLHRQLLNWEWYKNSVTKDVFIHILLNANYDNRKWEGIEIPRGTYITSLNTLTKELNLTPRKIRTALNNLKSTNEITIKTTNKYTRITIENYEKYQGYIQENDTVNEQQNDKRMTNERQQHNNIKNNNNIYSYFINIINKEDLKTFNDKMNLLHNIQNDDKYNELSPDEEYELRNYVLTKRREIL